MKKIDIVALAGAVLFTALALAGIVVGRDWKMLLVPLAMLPAIRVFGADSTTRGLLPNFVSASDVFAAREIMLALLATAGTFAISARFATGKCGWIAGVMTAAIAAISTTRAFSGNSRHRLLFVFCMLGATGFGALFVFPLFVVARAWLGVRDSRKEVAA